MDHLISFLHSGDYVQATVEVMEAACKRFGAEQAGNVISECGFYGVRADKSDEEIIRNVLEETGIEINAEDIRFVRLLCAAEDAVERATVMLDDAVRMKDWRKK
ncbi:MAG TPA: hypothetical protein PK587_06795 [Syntrophales bacterium]|nr:hypothetical protein [Syntrophales bacterium]